MNYQVTLLKIFDAIQTDNDIVVKHALQDILNQKLKLPSRELSGILIIAAENQAHRITDEISKYNFFAQDTILAKYIHIARKILNNAKITIH